jgi:hypothetical protein
MVLIKRPARFTRAGGRELHRTAPGADQTVPIFVTRTREGRRNRYTINADGHLRHPLQEDHTVGELLVALGRLRPRRRRSA